MPPVAILLRSVHETPAAHVAPASPKSRALVAMLRDSLQLQAQRAASRAKPCTFRASFERLGTAIAVRPRDPARKGRPSEWPWPTLIDRTALTRGIAECHR
jgi:hypothetical protein